MLILARSNRQLALNSQEPTLDALKRRARGRHHDVFDAVAMR